jgi:hypothetical protein
MSTGTGEPFPPAVQRLVDSGRLRVQLMRREQVAALWRKAVESASDAELQGMSTDGSLRSAYDAGHLAALALLAVHGLRTGSGHGHHEVAFAAAAGFGHAGLADLVADSMEVRSLRKGSLYDPTIAGPAERAAAVAWTKRTLPAIARAMVAVNPELALLLRRDH